jgi:hypothetical protein
MFPFSTAKRAVALLTAAGLAAVTAGAADLHVPAQYATIQAAINAAQPGDAVVIADGTYAGAGNRELDYLGKAITVRSANGAANCIIDCEQAGRGVIFTTGETAAAVLDGLTIRNGQAPTGGAVLCNDDTGPTIRNCIFTANQATQPNSYGGGALHCYRRNTVTIEHCTFAANQATNQGGAVSAFYSSEIHFTDCDFTENYTPSFGSAVVSYDSSVTLTNCQVHGNHAGGGAVIVVGGSGTLTDCSIADNTNQPGYGSPSGVYFESAAAVTVQDCTFSGNHDGYIGGGLYCGNACTGTITDCTFTDNSALYGGAAACSFDVSVTFSGCTFEQNFTTSGDGGALWLQLSPVTVEDCQIRFNTSLQHGGGLALAGPAVVRNCTITQNSTGTYGAGGGILCSSGEAALITGCQITANSAGRGGGVYCGYNAIPWVVDCTISGNHANGYGGFGGGFGCEGDGGAPVLINTALTGNDCLYFGGGFHATQNVAPLLLGCTISGNSNEYYGGGVSFGYGVNGVLANCTLAANSARYGGGLAATGSGHSRVVNCVITNNQATERGGGVFISDDHDVALRNSTVVYNSADEGGGVEFENNNPAQLIGCVLAGNTATSSGPQGRYWGMGSLTVSYSAVGGGQQGFAGWSTLIWGAGNLAGDPHFVDSDGADNDPATWQDNNYRLASNSPCIDAGDNVDPALRDPLDLDNDGGVTDPLPTDRDGLARYVDAPGVPDTGRGTAPLIDMGAYEYGATANLPPGPWPGDLNCDGAIDFDDIDPFVLALSDPATYHVLYPDCDILNTDCNNDGAINFDDIDLFVAILSGGG